MNLVRRYRPGQGATFRNQFNDAVARGVRAGELNKEAESILLRARNLLENWHSARSSRPDDAYRDWLGLWREGRDRIPSSVWTAITARLPKSRPAAFDWSSVLQSTDVEVLNQLVGQGAIKVKTLEEFAQGQPGAFLGSAALDVLLARKKSCPRAVWDAPYPTDRPTTLMSLPRAMVLSYSFDRGKDASGWLIRMLLSSKVDTASAVEELCAHPRVFHRLLDFLVTQVPERRKPDLDLEAARVQILSKIIGVLELDVVQRSTTGRQALNFLAALYTRRLLDAAPLSLESQKAIDASMERVGPAVTNNMLRAAEQRGETAVRELLVVGRADQVYRGVQTYIRSLRAASDSDTASGSRGSRLERYHAQKEILEHLARLMRDSSSESALRDELQVTLFNAGVRKLGTEGDVVPFDPYTHVTQTPGILAGELVLVVRPGYRMGEDVDSPILVRSRVISKVAGQGASA